MAYIENEMDFRAYMEEFGPKGKASRSNYISWLNFISDVGFNISTNLKSNDKILLHLKNNENNRDKYKSKDAYSDFGSALNKYRKFIGAEFGSIIDDLKKIDKDDIPETEKQRLYKARIGQGKFRSDLIKLWKKCSVSKIERVELLIASHILPWRNSSNQERLDKYNGLLLLPNYDKLFDKGLVSFSNNGKIIISTKINRNEYNALGIKPEDRLLNVNAENIKYLEKHREIFKEILGVK